MYSTLNTIIKNELDRNRRIAIYPFGEIGMMARNILEIRYGQKAILIDNNLKYYNPQIYSISDFEKIDSEDITIVLCTNKIDLNARLSQQVRDMNLKASLINILPHEDTLPVHNITMKAAKKPCVLQRKAEKCGLFSFFIVFLGGINYCIKNNLLPVIDMLSYENVYQGIGETVNPWEVFFEQPMGSGLTEVDNAIYIDCNQIEDIPSLSVDALTNDKKVSYWRKICRQYIRLSDDAKCYVKQYMEKYMPLGSEKETIGVLCRGTDYKELEPFGHPVQPNVYQMIAKIRSFMEKHKCKYVYLATEDKHIGEIFSREFGEELIIPNVSRYEDTGKLYIADKVKESGDIYKEGMDYLASIWVLSKCKCLVAGRTSGSVSALILSDGYDEVCMWNEGYYGIDV